MRSQRIRFTPLRITEGASSIAADVSHFLQDHFCTIFHEPAFNEIVRNNFGTDFYYCAAVDGGGQLLALCPVHAIKNGWLSVLCSSPAMYEVPYGGWVYDRDRSRVDILIRSMSLSLCQGLTYWSIPQVEKDDFAGFEPKKAYLTSVIDLGMDENVIWDSVISSKRRNMVRKAEKRNVSVRILRSDEFDSFHALMRETYDAAELELKPKDYYLQLLHAYSENKKMLVMIAEKDGEPLAGVVLLRNRYFCHYWLGAGKKSAENLGQGEILQWEAIKWAKQMGCQYYDMCVVESERLPNIARFKMGFSRTTVPFYCITRKRLGYRLGLRIQNAFG